GGPPDAALCRRPPDPGGRRPGATGVPVRPAQGTTPTGNGGDRTPQRLRTGRRCPGAEPGYPDDLRASAEGDVLHGLEWSEEGDEDGDQGGLRDRGSPDDAGAVAGAHGRQPEPLFALWSRSE